MTNAASATGLTVTSCRSCGSHDLVPFLDLGTTPIANALADDAASARARPRHPLGLLFCRRCTLVQLGYVLPAEAVFDDAYPYYSSFSDAFCRHAAAHVEGLLAGRALGPQSLVVELASNDGYLLKNFLPHGVPVLGIDPSPGPAAAGVEAGVDTICEFFTPALASALRSEGRRADVIIANNVMAHVPDLNGFVEGMAILLADDGVLTVENPYVRDLIRECEFDTVYHEHYCYFSTTAVAALMERHGLRLIDVDHFPNLHGGTLRWTIARNGTPTTRALEILRREEGEGMTDAAFYMGFGDRVDGVRERLGDLLVSLATVGSIAAYGAAAKGATLLNTLHHGADTLRYVVDRNPHKVGRWMPGVGLEVRDVDALRTDPPDHLLLLAWNFAAEIVSQQASYAEAGGRFVLPIPEPRVA